jgi:tetratricopeptide (TPR) repeat protein
MTKMLRVFSLGLAVVFLTASAVPAFSGQKNMDDKDRLFLEKFRMTYPDLRNGEALLKKKQYDKAEQAFLKVLNQLPENAEASFDLAETYYEKGEFDKGLAAIGDAEKNLSQILKILYRQQMGSINKSTDDRAAASDALQALRQQLGSSRSTAGSYTAQLGALQNQSSMKAGEQEQKSEVFAVPAEYSYVHGNLLFRLKRYQEALDEYLKAVQTDPKHGKSYNNIANIYFMAKQYDKSLEYVEKAESVGVKVNPDFKKAVLKALGK